MFRFFSEILNQKRMNHLLPIEKRNSVLSQMAELLEQERANLKTANQQDYDG